MGNMICLSTIQPNDELNPKGNKCIVKFYRLRVVPSPSWENWINISLGDVLMTGISRSSLGWYFYPTDFSD